MNLLFRPQDLRFNTQPHEGGCWFDNFAKIRSELVSTHSRAEAAALHRPKVGRLINRFNTQPR